VGHHLNSAQRNGGDGVYSGVFLAFALLVVITIGLWTTTGVAVASRIDFTPVNCDESRVWRLR